MTYVLLAIGCSVVGSLPLFIFKEAKLLGVAIVAIESIVAGMVFYMLTPSLIYYQFSLPAFFLMLYLVISTIFITDESMGTAITIWVAVAGILFGTWVTGWEMLNSKTYARLIGSIEKRVWTQDIQPKDPKHMRMGTTANALFMARKVLGEAGAIGSQFEINSSDMTLQMINKRLVYVVPLDFRGFWVWNDTNRAPGYIMVDAEDPHSQPILKLFPQGQGMIYTPGAFFGNNLERYLRQNGYLTCGLDEYNFEIDDQGNPWWVVTTFKPTISVYAGPKVTGAVMVQPVTGEIKFYEIDKMPGWVDRVFPRHYLKSFLNYWGEYSEGWWNSTVFGAKRNLMEAEKPNLIYGADGEPVWVTGITSLNNKDESLIGLVYTHSRSGKSVYYETKGGGTDKAVLDSVNKNTDVNFRKLHGVDPQLYNVYDTMASVVPLLAENFSFQGVAIVNIKNVQLVAVGRDQYEALAAYQHLLTASGQQIALDKTRTMQKVVGVVERCKAEIMSNGVDYYIILRGVPHVFTGGKNLSPLKLPLTEKGDQVEIMYYASGEDKIPMAKFENKSIQLKATAAQTEVRQDATERREEERTKATAETVKEKLKELTPEQLRDLEKHIKK